MRKSLPIRKYLLITAVIMFAIFSTISLANATPTDYAVTNNYHGIDCPLGASPIVTATTTDPDVQKVTFIWHLPDGTVHFTDADVAVTTDANGVKTATSTHVVDVLGDWGVQALFIGPGGKVKEGFSDVIATRGTSFNVVPEIPLIGTAGASIAMFAGLAVKMKRKPQN